MTVAEILSNEELRQQEFPVAKDKIFLAHAGVCALPRRVSDAIRAYAQQCTLGDQETLIPALEIQKSRDLAARLLQVTADEIAFIGPTSLGLSFVAAGLPWRRGDNMLVYFDDYPSNVYPWMALAEKGVQVRFLNIRRLGTIREIDVLGQVDENTRLVALASNHFIAGYRIDIASIGQALRKKGVLFCVDAIQTLGAFPTPAQHVDFAAADAHKWLLGPCAAGILYVRREVQQRLKPVTLGWHNVECPGYSAQEQISFMPNARRYEAGTENLLGLVGLHAAMELLLNVGVENIAAEILRKRAWLVPALQAKGFEVLNADAAPEHASGIISFSKAGVDLGSLHKQLESAAIVTSLRSDRSGRDYIRLSPHFYNTDGELSRLLDLI